MDDILILKLSTLTCLYSLLLFYRLVFNVMFNVNTPFIGLLRATKCRILVKILFWWYNQVEIHIYNNTNILRLH